MAAPANPDPNRARTRAGNANTHPGTAAKDALRVRNPPRDPEVIQKEKQDKEVKKAEKQKATDESQIKQEAASRFIKEYRALKDSETEGLNKSAAIPRQKPKGQC